MKIKVVHKYIHERIHSIIEIDEGMYIKTSNRSPNKKEKAYFNSIEFHKNIFNESVPTFDNPLFLSTNSKNKLCYEYIKKIQKG
jgi:hypothetical protein